MIAEFVAEDAGGNGDHVVLGDEGPVDGPDGGSDAVDPTIQVAVTDAPAPGNDGRLRLRVRDTQGGPVLLGSYLGTSAHVTGFHEESGAVVHLHPFSAPDVTEQSSSITFHSDIERAGEYRLLVQECVDGFLHTVPVAMTVT